MSEEKICFVISPIGQEQSETRKRSDQIFKYVIHPVTAQHGYKAIRADHISNPGVITTQIVEKILNSPLVVADLTDHNPNVLYELALRHAIRKPVVQMIQAGQSLPFDIAAQRTIQVDHKDLDSISSAKEELSRQIIAVEKDPTQVDSPVSLALDLNVLKRSSKPIDSALLEMVSMLQEIKLELRHLTQIVPRKPLIAGRFLQSRILQQDSSSESMSEQERLLKIATLEEHINQLKKDIETKTFKLWKTARKGETGDNETQSDEGEKEGC